jgi:hypothetical protein
MDLSRPPQLLLLLPSNGWRHALRGWWWLEMRVESQRVSLPADYTSAGAATVACAKDTRTRTRSFSHPWSDPLDCGPVCCAPAGVAERLGAVCAACPCLRACSTQRRLPGRLTGCSAPSVWLACQAGRPALRGWPSSAEPRPVAPLSRARHGRSITTSSISPQAGLPAELKHINKRRKRNQQGFP